MIGRLVWYGDFPLEKTLELLKKIGYEYIELSLDYPFPESLNAKEVKELLETFDVEIAFHSPLDVFIAQPRDEIFEASLKIVDKCLNFASNFEPLYYNYHITYFTPTREFEKVREKIIENGKAACQFILKRTKEFGYEACLEFDRNFDEKFLVDDLKVCLDVGHFILANKEDYLKEIDRFAKKYGERIIAAHVHDCKLDRRIDHISLGKGEAKLEEFLGKFKAKYYTIETFWRDSERNELRDVDVICDLELLRNILAKGGQQDL